MPVISAHTEARGEGYFRLEWKLADERTHLMAKGVPFLLPVVVDATADGEAMVPDSFRTVQWTRLPGGAPTPEFVALVKRLLEAPRRPAGSRTRESLAEKASDPTGQTLTSSATRKRPLPMWVWAAAVIAIGVGATFFATRKPASASGDALARSASKGPPVAEKATPKINEKSLAVVPFESLSPDQENEFFTSAWREAKSLLARRRLRRRSEARESHRGRGYHRPRRHEFFRARIHPQVQALQRAAAKERQVAGLGEHDLVGGLSFIHPQHRVAYRAGDDLPVGHLNLQVFFPPLDADFFKNPAVDPREFGARVDHEPGDGGRFAVDVILNLTTDMNAAHGGKRSFPEAKRKPKAGAKRTFDGSRLT